MSSGDFTTGYLMGTASDDPNFFPDAVMGMEFLYAGFLFSSLEVIPKGEGVVYGIAFVIIMFFFSMISKTLAIIIATLLTGMVGITIYYMTKDMSIVANIIAIAISILIAGAVNFSELGALRKGEDDNKS